MRYTSLVALALALYAGSAAAKPQIAEKIGVRNLTAVSAPQTIARGSVFVVTGSELGPAEESKAEVPYGQDLGGVSVAFTTSDGSGVVLAYIVSASATRIVAILPSRAAAGDCNVTVTANGEVSEPFAAKVADRNVGILTVDGQAGSGAVAKILVPGSDPVAAGFTHPLRPGQTVELSAAGLGSNEMPDNEPMGHEMMLAEGALILGSLEIPATFIGRNPQKPGYDIVRFVVPESGLPVGCAVNVAIKIGDMVTPKAAVPVVATAEDPACVHPLGLTSEGLRTLDEGGTITLGSFSIIQQSVKLTVEGFTLETKTESLDGTFVRHNAASLGGYLGSSEAGWLANPVGCNVWSADDSIGLIAPGELVDAGELSVKGPGGLDKVVPKVADTNSYHLDLAPAGGGFPALPTIPGLPIPGPPGIQKGTYTLSGKGGTVVGAFTVDNNVPAAIEWTNRDDPSTNLVDRGADLSFLWTGAGNDGDMATAIGLSRGPAPEDTTKVVTRTFICFAPTTAGKIVVPPSILQQMPANAGDNPEFVGALMLQHTNGSNVPRLTAPLVGGGSTEPGTFNFTYGTMKQAAYK